MAYNRCRYHKLANIEIDLNQVIAEKREEFLTNFIHLASDEDKEIYKNNTNIKKLIEEKAEEIVWDCELWGTPIPYVPACTHPEYGSPAEGGYIEDFSPVFVVGQKPDKNGRLQPDMIDLFEYFSEETLEKMEKNLSD